MLGHQNTDIWGNRTSDFALYAANKGWLVQQPYLNQQYTESFTENFNVRLNVEPIKHFKIELTANRSTSRNEQVSLGTMSSAKIGAISRELTQGTILQQYLRGILRLSMMMKSTIPLHGSNS